MPRIFQRLYTKLYSMGYIPVLHKAPNSCCFIIVIILILICIVCTLWYVLLRWNLKSSMFYSCHDHDTMVNHPDSIKRCHLTSIGNPIVEIKWSYDRLISTMGFPILVRWHLHIESAPWCLKVFLYFFLMLLLQLLSFWYCYEIFTGKHVC